MVGHFNTPMTPMERSFHQKINKEVVTLNDRVDQMDLTDIFRTFHPKTAQYSFFSHAHGKFPTLNKILGHKTSQNKIKPIDVIPCVFSDHNAMKVEVSNKKKKSAKGTKTWKLNSMLLNNQWVNQEIKDEIEITWKQMKMKTQQSKLL